MWRRQGRRRPRTHAPQRDPRWTPCLAAGGRTNNQQTKFCVSLSPHAAPALHTRVRFPAPGGGLGGAQCRGFLGLYLRTHRILYCTVC